MKPAIVVSSLDYQRLHTLLDAMPAPGPVGKTQLLEELARADVVEPAEVPSNVVTMNSKVRFMIENSREEFCMNLVYPKDVAPSDTLSVLSPVGSALLGLAEGDSIEWPHPGGSLLSLKVLGLEYQPERARALHL
jgi:regulator of nucleoside diphosphate kinase